MAEPGRVEFARDSPLEGDGFEPSVPREMGYRYKTASCASVTGFIPERTHPFATGDRGFEFVSPQRRVQCEPSLRFADLLDNKGTGQLVKAHLGACAPKAPSSSRCRPQVSEDKPAPAGRGEAAQYTVMSADTPGRGLLLFYCKPNRSQ
jgi:hypothetical protein